LKLEKIEITGGSVHVGHALHKGAPRKG
jgi:hypothetical protein